MTFLSKLVSVLKKNTVQEIPVTEPEIVYGTHGRLEIPALELFMPLYDAQNGNAQHVVDRPDSAAFLRSGSISVIADHVSQGNFRNLIYAKPGVTIAEIRFNDGTPDECYICQVSQFGHIELGTGRNGGNQLTDWKRDPVLGQIKNVLVIYTCLGYAKDGVQNVTLTYWTKEE